MFISVKIILLNGHCNMNSSSNSFDAYSSPSVGLVFPQDAPLREATLLSGRHLIVRLENECPGGSFLPKREGQSLVFFGSTGRRLTVSDQTFVFESDHPSVRSEGSVDSCPASILQLLVQA
jgi:hypothetical protein